MKTLLFLKRNLQKIPFASEKAAEIVQKELDSIDWIKKGHWIKEINEEDEALLLKHFYTQEKSPLYWLEPRGSILLSLGGTDHLTIRTTLPWQELKQIIEQMQHKLPFAYSKEFGFLTSTLDYLGTGLKAVKLIEGRLEIEDEFIESFPFFSDTLIQNRRSIGNFESTIIQCIEKKAEEYLTAIQETKEKEKALLSSLTHKQK